MIKKFLRKTVSLLLLLSLLAICLSSCRAVFAGADESKIYTYLVAGFDDAADNTDVLMLIGYDTEDNSITVLQIPRDTYYAYGTGQNKINGIYASYRISGMSERSALDNLTSDLEAVFGIEIDGNIGVTTEAFRSIIDAIGGVRITVSEERVYTDEHGENELRLKKGENLLTSREAELFVRYRKGYAMGDLARIDAQKLFVSGLFDAVRTGIGADELVRAVFAARNGVYTNCKISDILEILMKFRGRIANATARYITLPGEATMAQSGVSYYSVNRKGAEYVLNSYFGADTFDPQKKLLDGDDPSFYNIYYDENAEHREYSTEGLDDLRIY